MMKAMPRPNRPVASASAKPMKAGAVICCWVAGLRAIEVTSAAKMLPMPMPAPTSAIQARPAPIILAEARSMAAKPFLGWLESERCDPPGSMQMDGVVEIDAGEDGEDEGLQERHQQLERDQEDVEEQRQDAEQPHADDEAGEDHQHGVADHHV